MRRTDERIVAKLQDLIKQTSGPGLVLIHGFGANRCASYTHISLYYLQSTKVLKCSWQRGVRLKHNSSLAVV